MNRLRRRLAGWLRKWADRISADTAPHGLGWSFTFEPIPRRPNGPPVRIEWSLKFRDDGHGCPLWYLGEDDYARAHDEADAEHTVVLWSNILEGREPKTRRAGGRR